ncbi:hypothetical protein [Schlesneria paludicola]|uniref:hypothetical protein n=1 Tax=Schlesneria paludicola TaxID=360056 RepID=UPI0036F249C3
MIVNSIMAILAGADGPTSIPKWALLKSDFLLHHLDLPTAFLEWMSSVVSFPP